jgi:hypothetical protein
MYIHERRWDEATKCLRAAMKASEVGAVQAEPRKSKSRWFDIRKLSCADFSMASESLVSSPTSLRGTGSGVNSLSSGGASPRAGGMRTNSTTEVLEGTAVVAGGGGGMEHWALAEMRELYSIASALMESIVALEAEIQARVAGVEKLNTELLRDGMVDLHGAGSVFGYSDSETTTSTPKGVKGKRKKDKLGSERIGRVLRRWLSAK